MIIPFQNILFLQEFLACNGCFGLFTKIKKGSGTSFWCIFSAWFFHKNVPYLILYQWPKFQCHTFVHSQDIKQNVLVSGGLQHLLPSNPHHKVQSSHPKLMLVWEPTPKLNSCIIPTCVHSTLLGNKLGTLWLWTAVLSIRS